MGDKVFDGEHVIFGREFEGKHSTLGNYLYGNHIQEWFGDRFISGIQAENLEFIKDSVSKIILEE